MGQRRLALLVPSALVVTLVLAAVALAAPSADFSYSPAVPTAGQTVTFTAATECDADTTCAWSTAGQTGSGQTFKASFPAGPRTVTLTVTDGAEQTKESKTILVLPAPNAPPTARIGVGGSPVSDQPIALAGSGSSDPEGGPLAYAWSVEPSGAIAAPRAADTSLTVPAPGAYTVTLRVTDSAGGSDTASATLNVTNPAPTAVIAVAPRSPLSLQQVTFDSSGSTDPNNAIVLRRWSIDGVESAGVATQRTFGVPGSKRVRLTVRDEDGATGAAETTITVRNQLPTAEIAYDPNPVFPGQTVNLTAKASDPENRIARYSWDLNGDGTFGDRTGDRVSTTFPRGESRLTVAVRVTDRDDGAVEARQTIVAGNRKPTAGFDFSPSAPEPGQPVTFVSTSSDPDGPIARQEWDVDADGDFDDGTGLAVTRAFPAAGTYSVSLRVTDTDGTRDLVVREINIGGGANPAGPGDQFASQGPLTPATPPSRRRAGAKLLRPFPVVRVSGTIMRYGAMFRLVTVRTPGKTRIAISCRGRGCPRARLAYRARLLRLRRLQGYYGDGARIEVRVTRKGYIGKYTRITVRAGKPPARIDRCLRPNAKRPSRCPRT